MLERHPLEVLAEEFSCRLRSGETPTIEEYEALYPQYGQQIRSLFRPLVLLEKLGSTPPAQPGGSTARASSAGMVGRTLGEFQILREIGRGGMGVVYEAEQKSLKRRVALKVLAPGVADSSQERRRFEREASAAAGLHHTNIVPVFGIGDHGGTLYYAMQWIDGVPLNRVIPALHRMLRERTSQTARRAELGLPPVGVPPAVPVDGFTAEQAARLLLEGGPWRNVARIVAEIADALHHAHEQGVLHRDIKPSNLLLDRCGHVWIADFGLAKHEDHESVTRTGDIVGTLRYMAPEQLSGHADARSDIYSLGLTLHELLTGRPAFDETPHARLIQRKTTAGVARPRTINRSIPRDLETVALMACACEPAQRYRRAADLAADLHRFLDDRPVLAQRVGIGRRLGHWARRNPSWAAAAALISSLLIALVVVSSVGNYRTGQALIQVRAEQVRAMASAEEARQQGLRAEQNLQLALRAFQQIVANVSARGAGEALSLSVEDIDAPPADLVVTPADTQLLETVLDFFGQFASTNGVDLDLQSAEAWKTVGDIQQRLARLDDADQAYRRALAIYDALRSQTAETLPAVLGRARILNEMAVVASRQGNVREAVELHQQASQLLEELPEIVGQEEARYELAKTCNLLGSVGLRAGWASLHSAIASPTEDERGGPAPVGPPRFGPLNPRHRPRHRNSDDERQSQAPAEPEVVNAEQPAGFRRGPGRSRDPGRNHIEHIRQSNQKALDILETLVDKSQPDNARYRLELAHCHQNRCRWDWLMGDAASAETAHQTAIAVLERLVADFPDAPAYRFELADTLALALPPRRSQPSAEASEIRSARIIRAMEIAEQLHADYPHVADYQAVLATAAFQLAEVRYSIDMLDSARDLLISASQWQRELAERYPLVVVYHLSLAQSLASLAEVYRGLGRDEDARQSLESAIAGLHKLDASGSQSAGRTAQRMAERLERRQHAAGG